MDFKMIPVSNPYIDIKDLRHFKKLFKSKILTDGFFQKKCEKIIKKKISSKFVALTHSCTGALEISALLINLKKGDEVIIPSYGFVSIANAIVMRGAKPIFAEIDPQTLNISYDDIIKKINKKTKAVYVIHYAGNACDIYKIKKYLKKKNIYLIEDAAHSFLSQSRNKYLGTIGDIGVFSFHETKNLVSGQGGCISINNPKLKKRANFILDKGTDRYNFIRNYKKKLISSKIKKYYSWVDYGSEYRASELTSALLYSQLLKVNEIQKKREQIWKKFKSCILNIENRDFYIIEPLVNTKSSYHLFVIIFKDQRKSQKFIDFMQKNLVAATFHYVPLHKSKMAKKITKQKLLVTEKIFKRVVRLPLYPDMKLKDQKKIMNKIKEFCNE